MLNLSTDLYDIFLKCTSAIALVISVHTHVSSPILFKSCIFKIFISSEALFMCL